jgi:hypothetical protein
MLYSGADLIRTSGQQLERLEKLEAVAPVRPVSATTASSDQSNTLDENTHSALLRFARFVHDNKKQAPKPHSSKKSGSLPETYLIQIAFSDPETREANHVLDLYA